jgi:hypothetical protein
MQLLEGPKEAVQKTMSRVREDWRHTHILVLLEGAASQRNFPAWTMALPEPNEFNDEALRKYGPPDFQQVFSRIEFDKFIRILSTFGTVCR